MLINWDGSGQPECEAVWGHVSPDEFWAAIKAQRSAYHYGTIEELKASHGVPRHTYVRCVKAEERHRDDYDFRYLFDCAPLSGAAKCTIANRRSDS